MSNGMKGYKALSPDMKAIRGDGMQFELGKEYTVTGKITPCSNGYHFCKRIEDLNVYYPIHENRIFEIEASGTIKFDGSDKYASESIKLVREISQQEIKDYFKLNYKEFIQSKYWWVRTAIASYGYGLDILVNNENTNVRKEIARLGYGLDILIKDEDKEVRREVEKQGYGLDVFLYDKSSDVRETVVRQGYRLDILIHDKNPFIRAAVASQGYGLDILSKDEYSYVRAIANNKLAEINK